MSAPDQANSMLRRILAILTAQNVGMAVGACTLLGVVFTVAGAWANRNADIAFAVRHAVEFEASVDKRLVELRDWQRQTDADREVVRSALQAKVNELQARFDQRKEVRDEQLLQQNQRISAVEFRVCYLSKVPLSQCK